jgi:hypothetical protein
MVMTREEVDGLFHNKNVPGFDQYDERTQMHCERVLRHGREFAGVLRQQAGVHEGLGTEKTDQGTRSALEACIHTIADIAEGNHPQHSDIKEP